MPDSLKKRLEDAFRAKKELTEEQRKQVLAQIMEGVQSTGEQKELYRIRVNKAIEKAQRAVKAGDVVGKWSAMDELRAYYGFYRYMSTLQGAFRAMQSHIQIQTATRDFARMVDSFSRIRIQDKPVNFDMLLGKALKSFQPMDTTGLDKLLNGLFGYSTAVPETDTAEDAFLEALVSGQATLDTPYSSAVAQAIVQPAAQETSADADKDMMALLNQMLEGLKE